MLTQQLTDFYAAKGNIVVKMLVMEYVVATNIGAEEQLLELFCEFGKLKQSKTQSLQERDSEIQDPKKLTVNLTIRAEDAEYKRD